MLSTTFNSKVKIQLNHRAIPDMALPDCELRGIDHVVIRVHQLAPMLNFYCDILGACLKKRKCWNGTLPPIYW